MSVIKCNQVYIDPYVGIHTDKLFQRKTAKNAATPKNVELSFRMSNRSVRSRDSGVQTKQLTDIRSEMEWNQKSP